MAKVELVSGLDDWDDGCISSSFDEYADKVWLEFQTHELINELVDKRRVLQHKLDAARKRLKRLVSRLNVIEHDGMVNPI